jgi:hypothetical protein
MKSNRVFLSHILAEANFLIERTRTLGPAGGPGAIRLRLDDGALGIALVDRARGLCPPNGRCVLRLVGFWKGGDATGGHFDVRRVDGLVPEGADRVIETARRTPW